MVKTLKKKTTDIPGLLKWAHSLGGFAVVPTEQGVIKGKALNAMHEQTQEKMDMLYEQMKLLANQAQEIRSRVEISHEIYSAEINFRPLIGSEYFLYTKKNGGTVLSLVGPDEWGKSPVYPECLAKVKLLSDSTWKLLIDYRLDDKKD